MRHKAGERRGESLSRIPRNPLQLSTDRQRHHARCTPRSGGEASEDKVDHCQECIHQRCRYTQSEDRLCGSTGQLTDHPEASQESVSILHLDEEERHQDRLRDDRGKCGSAYAETEYKDQYRVEEHIEPQADYIDHKGDLGESGGVVDADEGVAQKNEGEAQCADPQIVGRIPIYRRLQSIKPDEGLGEESKDERCGETEVERQRDIVRGKVCRCPLVLSSDPICHSHLCPHLRNECEAGDKPGKYRCCPGGRYRLATQPTKPRHVDEAVEHQGK